MRGAREHNLRNVDVEFPRGGLIVITGLSGSGKSSLAFDTIYAEGQRRYVESLSAYARQFLGLMEKPDVDSIEGLSPAISIEQKTVSRNPRSTVGTVTEVYDYLRLLWARVGVPHCTECGRPVLRQSASQIVERLLLLDEGAKIQVLAPLVRGRKGEFRDLFEKARKEGFVRAVVDGEMIDLSDPPALNRYENHDIAIVVDRLVLRPEDRERLADSVETALRSAEGTVEVREAKGRSRVSHFFSESYACAHCGTSLPEIEPRQFSFNSPYGACRECGGLGTSKHVNPDLLLADGSISLLEGVVLPWGEPSGHLRTSVIAGLAEAYEFDPRSPWKKIPEEARHAIMHGSDRMKIRFPYRAGSGSAQGHYEDTWDGVIDNVERRYKETKSDSVRTQLHDYMSTLTCTACGGSRLRAESLAVTIASRSLGEIVDLSIAEALEFFRGLPVDEPIGSGVDRHALHGEIATAILKEIQERLGFLNDVGLNYLTLGRSAGLPLRGRVSADSPGHPDREPPGGRALHPGRALRGTPSEGQPASSGDPSGAPRLGQHRDCDRTRRGDDPGRRPHCGPGTRSRTCGWRGRGSGVPGRCARGRGVPHGRRIWMVGGGFRSRIGAGRAMGIAPSICEGRASTICVISTWPSPSAASLR